MTNIQAINLLKGLEQSLDDYCELNDEGKTAFRMAITALEVFGNSEQLPSVQPEPCEDAVSRKAVLDMLHQECSSMVENFLKEKINALLSVTPKQRWIPCDVRMPEEPFGCWLSVHVDSPHYSEKNIVYHNIYGWDGESWNDSYGEPVEWTVYEKVVAWCKAKLPEPYMEEGEQE